MVEKEIRKNMKDMNCARDKRGILEFENYENIIFKLCNDPKNYNFEIRKILVENMYENIKFISGWDKNRVFFEKLGINRNLSLENKKDVDLLYDFLVKLVQKKGNKTNIGYVFFNHKSREFYRKDTLKSQGKNVDMKKIIFETLDNFLFEWYFLLYE